MAIGAHRADNPRDLSNDAGGGVLRRASALLVLVMLVVLVPASPPAFAALSPGSEWSSFAGASTTSLTLKWPKASGARGYQVWKSLHKNMAYRTSRPDGERHRRHGLRADSRARPTASRCRERPGRQVGAQVGGHRASRPFVRRARPRTGVQGDDASTPAPTRAAAGPVVPRPPGKMIRVRDPDVLAVQEAGGGQTPPSGYALAVTARAPSESSTRPPASAGALEGRCRRDPDANPGQVRRLGRVDGPEHRQADDLRQRPHLARVRRLPARGHGRSGP